MGDDSLSEGPLPIIWIIGKFEGIHIFITTSMLRLFGKFCFRTNIFIISFQGVQEQEELHNANSWSCTQIFVILAQEMLYETK